MVFKSWPHVAAFAPLDGEPAMSLIPDLLISGVLSVLIALAHRAGSARSPAPHPRRWRITGA